MKNKLYWVLIAYYTTHVCGIYRYAPLPVVPTLRSTGIALELATECYNRDGASSGQWIYRIMQS